MKEAQEKLNHTRIFIFWYPLALTWLMMAIEGPFLAAIVARLPDPKINLAAHGVTFAIAVIIEAPIIMMLSASTALAKDRVAYLRLRNFNLILCVTLTAIMVIAVTTPGMTYVTRTLIELPKQVSKLTVNALVILLPWPAAIGLRRFYQGILIAGGQTRKVAYGTVVRLVTMAATSTYLFVFSQLEGVYVGACAMSVGVVFEAFATRFMAGRVIQKVLATKHEKKPISYWGIINFYYPLALTTTITLVVQPMVSFFLGHARMSLESLAVMPVIGALVFMFRSVGHSFLEAAISLLGDNNENRREIKSFAVIISLLASIGLMIIAYTPLSQAWFGGVSGLTQELSNFAKFPLCILAFVPASAVWLSYQRAILVKSGHTLHVTISTIIEATVTIGVLLVGIFVFDFVGIIVTAVALSSARIAGNLYLIRPTIKS